MQSSPPLFIGDLVQSRRIIYQPSSFAMQNLLYLQETGSLTAIKPHTSSRQNLSSFLFFYVEEGEGSLTYQNQIYSMKKDDCAFIDCRNKYSQGSSSKNLWALKWVHFYGSAMGEIYSKYLERGGEACFSVDSEKPNPFVPILDLIMETASSSSYIRDMKINEVLSKLLTLLMEYSWNPEKARKSNTKCLNVSDVKAFIDQNFTAKISLEVVAAQFNVNKSYLLRLFKEYTGLTVNNYILQKRILMAKNELRFTNKTLDVIAQECGLEEANYFIRVFKKIEGLTPGGYRKRW
ncbi:MAG: helix-turn-helix domain-containing protein [Treponema sp.]|nr:helix-turn-helix domain-containing protein [Treponema sp.]